jgi:hypothetical protein
MPDTQFSDNILERLKYFIEDNDPLRISRSLRRVFFDYLRFQDGVADLDFDFIVGDIEAVLDLLDRLVDERSSRDNKA